MNNLIRLVVVAIFTSQLLFAEKDGLYVPKEVQEAYASGTRSLAGTPGEYYWQNFAEYDISVELNPASRKLFGEEKIIYKNNSPDTLRYIVIKLLQNYHEQGASRDFPIAPEKINEGVQIEEVIVNGNKLDVSNRRQIYIYGTNMYAIFEKDSRVLPDSKTNISIKWNFDVPDLAIRVGAYNDSSYFMGYWFPQVAVYDDIVGWDNNQYTGLQETYNDLANFDIKITTPASYVVWATGELQNSQDIFSEKIQHRIDQSKNADEVIQIIQTNDYNESIVFMNDQNTTWHYIADGVPDFAFAMSTYYLWDACSVVVDTITNRRVWVNTAYPPTADKFKNAIEWASESIEYFSTVFPGIPFPYDKHISYNGQTSAAIEFPMIANDCDGEHEEFLTEIVAHEIAHCYFPFMVLTNERLYAWMDEGMVKLFGERFTEKYGNTRENFKALNTTKIYSRLAGSLDDLPLGTISTSLTANQNFSLSYAKAATANVYLLEMMEEKGIEVPLKEYFNRWEGKHPTPWDFYQTMNATAGEDLSWFWKPWYYEYAYPDLAIEEITQSETTNITILNKGGLPIPLVVEVIYDNGKVEKIHKSPKVWEKGNTYNLSLNTQGTRIEKIILGEKYIIDIFPENNEWKKELYESNLH